MCFLASEGRFAYLLQWSFEASAVRKYPVLSPPTSEMQQPVGLSQEQWLLRLSLSWEHAILHPIVYSTPSGKGPHQFRFHPQRVEGAIEQPPSWLLFLSQPLCSVVNKCDWNLCRRWSRKGHVSGKEMMLLKRRTCCRLLTTFFLYSLAMDLVKKVAILSVKF